VQIVTLDVVAALARRCPVVRCGSKVYEPDNGLETVVDGLATTGAIRRRTYSPLRRAVAPDRTKLCKPAGTGSASARQFANLHWAPMRKPRTARRSSIFRLPQRRVFPLMRSAHT
jgi:hypothetical protein